MKKVKKILLLVLALILFAGLTNVKAAEKVKVYISYTVNEHADDGDDYSDNGFRIWLGNASDNSNVVSCTTVGDFNNILLDEFIVDGSKLRNHNIDSVDTIAIKSTAWNKKLSNIIYLFN